MPGPARLRHRTGAASTPCQRAPDAARTVLRPAGRQGPEGTRRRRVGRRPDTDGNPARWPAHRRPPPRGAVHRQPVRPAGAAHRQLGLHRRAAQELRPRACTRARQARARARDQARGAHPPVGGQRGLRAGGRAARDAPYAGQHRQHEDEVAGARPDLGALRPCGRLALVAAGRAGAADRPPRLVVGRRPRCTACHRRRRWLEARQRPGARADARVQRRARLVAERSRRAALVRPGELAPRAAACAGPVLAGAPRRPATHAGGRHRDRRGRHRPERPDGALARRACQRRMAPGQWPAPGLLGRRGHAARHRAAHRLHRAGRRQLPGRQHHPAPRARQRGRPRLGAHLPAAAAAVDRSGLRARFGRRAQRHAGRQLPPDRPAGEQGPAGRRETPAHLRRAAATRAVQPRSAFPVGRRAPAGQQLARTDRLPLPAARAFDLDPRRAPVGRSAGGQRRHRPRDRRAARAARMEALRTDAALVAIHARHRLRRGPARRCAGHRAGRIPEL